MKTTTPKFFQPSRAALLASMLAATSFSASASEMNVTLSGDQEVPPVTTMATGTASIALKDDMSLVGKITTQGVEGTAAHIHSGAIGKNGPVVITLISTGDNEWMIPESTKIGIAQMDELESGGLYLNVHSDAHGSGEIRAQLQ